MAAFNPGKTKGTHELNENKPFFERTRSQIALKVSKRENVLTCATGISDEPRGQNEADCLGR